MKLKSSTGLFGFSLFVTAVTLSMPLQVGAQETSLEEIVVTGSNIRRNRDFETPSPIQTLGFEEISAVGAGQVQDIFKNLAVNAGSEISNSQNSRQGVSQFSLRGLGVAGTLTLINGRRAGLSPASSDEGFFFTDINQFPVNFIERVEILTDGASATYGSEAVAGVVNIITRKNFEGAELGVELRDATNNALSLNGAFGTSFEKGHFTTFINYYTQDGTGRGDFDFIRERDNGGNQLSTGSRFDSGTGAGSYALAVDPDGDGFFENSGNAVADPNCGEANRAGVVNTFVSGSNCRYSFIDQRAIVPEEDRLQVFSQFDYQLTDSVNFFSEASFSQNEIRDSIGGAVLNNRTDDGGVFVPGSSPFNYFFNDGNGGIVYDAARAATNPNDTVGVIFTGRPQAGEDGSLGDAIVRKFDSGRLVLGIDAELNDRWSLNASYVYSRTQFSDRQPRSYNTDALRAEIATGAFNPFFIASTQPNAVSVKDGVTQAINTEADFDAISANRVFQAESVQQVAEVIFSGDLFDIGGNTVVAAFGAQYRDFNFNDIADSLSEFGLDGRADPVFSIQSASQDVYALFAEAAIPVAENLEVQLAVRYEDYGGDEGGDTFDPKIGARWSVTDSLILRGSFGTSFQAPSIRNVAGAVGSGALEDFANGVAPGGQCNGVSDSFNTSQITAAGPGLTPQSAENINLGVVFQTDRFTGSIDFWNYDFKDLIQSDADFQSIVAGECVNGIFVPDARVQRNPSGQLSAITTEFTNIGSVEAQGIDLNGSFELGAFVGGDLKLSGVATLVTKFDIDADDNGNVFDGANNRNSGSAFGSLPDTRLNLSLDWRTERASANITGRYIGGYDDRTAGQTNDPIDSQLLIDAQYGLVWDHANGGSTAVTIGVNNMFDEDPPAIDPSSSNGRIAYDEQVGDPRGRIAYIRAKYNF